MKKILVLVCLFGFGCSGVDLIPEADTGTDTGADTGMVSDSGMESGTDTMEVCVPKVCEKEMCGEIDDGCGGKVNCTFECTYPKTCGGSPDFTEETMSSGSYREVLTKTPNACSGICYHAVPIYGSQLCKGARESGYTQSTQCSNGIKDIPANCIRDGSMYGAPNPYVICCKP